MPDLIAPIDDSMFLVSANLVAVPLTSAFDARRRWIEREERRQSDPRPRPLPVTNDGTLTPGELYPSSVDPQARYYLPAYTLNTRGGQYTTSLRFEPNGGDPQAPLAWLAVELNAAPPPSRALRVLEIEHRATVRLGYSLPVQRRDGTVRAAGAEPSIWVELGALEVTDDPLVRRCRLAIHTKPDFDRLFQAMTDSTFGAVLEVRCFAEVGYRTYRQIVVRDSSEILSGVVRRPNAAGQRAVPHTRLMVATAAVQPLLGGSGMIDPAAVTALPPLDRLARLPIPAQPITAPISRMPPQDTVIARPLPVEVAARPLPPASERVTPVLVRREGIGDTAPIKAEQLKPTPAVAELLRRTDLRIPIDVGDRLDLPGDVWDQPGIEDKPTRPTRPAIPVGAICEEDGEPALVEIEVQVSQRIAFHFPLDANRGMFDLPQGGTTVHRLLKSTVQLGDEQLEVYQDMGLPGQFYYEPQEFRLARTARLPDRPEYYPHLVAAVVPLVSGEGGAEVLYRVQLAYEALPYVEQRLLDAAREQLAGGDAQAGFTPIVPRTARLTLQVPSDGGDFVELLREGVAVDFAAGLSDSLTLTESQFRTIFTSVASGGVHGTVQVELIDGRVETVPLRLSFAETAGALFADTFNGPAGQPGVFRVTLQNRVESPVKIEALAPVRLTVGGQAAVAYPQPLSAPTVAPGESVAVDYQLAPANLLPTGLKPALSATVLFSAERLWERLLVNGGYTSATFAIEAAAEPEYFGPPPAGVEPLAALRLEFDCGVTVTLTAQAPRQTVTLRQPLLDHLLNRPDAMRYRFRVTDVHRAADGGERDGAQTGWLAGEGNLSAQPAMLNTEG